MSLVTDIAEAASFVRDKVSIEPRTAIVLGSGLGGLADRLSERESVPYETIPHFPRSSVIGHTGALIAGRLEGIPVWVMAGRVHAYEGYTAQDVVFPARVLGSLGVTTLVLTNAAGAIDTAFSPGELMIITDQLNLTGLNPLVGPELSELGLRFTDMSAAYDRGLITACERAAESIQLPIRRGVYAGLLGPSFETPAEIRMLRTMGASAVGMSTVLESIAARQQGIRVLGISCLSNMAAGILEGEVNHEEVMEIGKRVESRFIDLMIAVLPAARGDEEETSA